jgi:uncharacterized membrane protein YhaH (DUF805 family)
MQYYVKAFQNFTNFKGRARRREYWYFVLFHFLVSVTILLFSNAMETPLVHLGYVLIAFLPGLAVAIRRMHDVGKSGWFVLIPIYNLILACTDGDQGDNSYGLDPKMNYFKE